MELVRHNRANPIPEKVINIYLQSFPQEERRPVENLGEQIADGRIILHIAVEENGDILGMLTSWDFGTFCYIEHFAIDSARRNGGLGSRILEYFCNKICQRPVLLEVEPDGTSPEAQRRIDFYRRNGFEIIDKTYIQPAYTQSQPSLPLWLMSTTPIDTVSATITLHSEVYAVPDPDNI